LSTRQEIIREALRTRHAEVCNRVEGLESKQFTKWTAPKTWFASSCESLAAIRSLAEDERIECIEVEPPDTTFFDELHAASRDPRQRFQLLAKRYVHPLNIAAPSEDKVREHLLERLMVNDRARIEQNSLHLLDADDLALRLNLIAIYASLSRDLRYLDALNYYYELLPANWYQDESGRGHFLTFYARALVFHST
jgi:hypothetical protein